MCSEHSKKSIIVSFQRGLAGPGRKDFLSGMLVFILLSLAPMGARAETSGVRKNSSVPGAAELRALGPEELLLRAYRPDRRVDCFVTRAPGRGVLGFEVVTPAESAARPMVGLLEARELPRGAELQVHRSQSFLAIEASGGEVFTLCVAFLRPPLPGEPYQVVSAFAEEEDPGEDEPIPDPFGSSEEEEEDPEEEEPIPDPWSQSLGARIVAPVANG